MKIRKGGSALLNRLNHESNGSQSSYDEIETDHFKYLFVKAYLSALFQGRTAATNLKVLRLLARNSKESYRLRPITHHDSGEEGNSFVHDDSLEATVTFDGQPYELMLTRFAEPFRDEKIHYVIAALGLDSTAKKPRSLIRQVVRDGLQHSPYKNKFLNIVPPRERAQVAVEVEVVDVEPTSLSDIFLSESSRESIQLFIDCVKKYDQVGKSMRFLLNGKPGTGKTKIIRAVANEAKGLGTFVFTSGSDDRIDAVFELAECFSPVVVCMDDVDLLVGNRDRDSDRIALGKFLQYLDGFLGNGVFVLATTNDKKLVDMAASRPGRFDMILDINAISSKHYLDLISCKTNSEKVTSLFDERVIDVLEARKVTGAFISTLVKHLEVVEKLGYKDLDHEYVMKTIDRLNAGFYKEPETQAERIGFLG